MSTNGLESLGDGDIGVRLFLLCCSPQDALSHLDRQHANIGLVTSKWTAT